MQGALPSDAHGETFLDLAKLATRHISRSIFTDQVGSCPCNAT